MKNIFFPKINRNNPLGVTIEIDNRCKQIAWGNKPHKTVNLHCIKIMKWLPLVINNLIFSSPQK